MVRMRRSRSAKSVDDIGTEREKEKHRDYKEGRKKERKGIQIEMERILRREQEK